MRRVPRCGPSVPLARVHPTPRLYASTPNRDWKSLAYHPGAQWKPRLDERAAIWLAKRKREMNADNIPVSENDLLTGSKQAFYVVAELLSPMLEKKDVPPDESLRKLFTPLMVRWYHEYREEYSLETRKERKEKEEKLADEEDDDDELAEDEAPVLWESKHEVMDTELLRWDDNQGIIRFTSSARFPYAISGRMLFDHLWLFKYAVPRGSPSEEKRFLLHEIIYPEL